MSDEERIRSLEIRTKGMAGMLNTLGMTLAASVNQEFSTESSVVFECGCRVDMRSASSPTCAHGACVKSSVCDAAKKNCAKCETAVAIMGLKWLVENDAMESQDGHVDMSSRAGEYIASIRRMLDVLKELGLAEFEDVDLRVSSQELH